MASPPRRLVRLLTHPFAPTTTPLQATTYLLAVSLFSIAFLVFLNSEVSFVVTDLLGRRDGVGDVVGTLGFADELVALVACPAWGLVSDRLGVRWVAVLGYAVVAAALVVSVHVGSVYPGLLLARVFFAVGATATATMVTAILPSLTDETTHLESVANKPAHGNAPHSPAPSIESRLTITPRRCRGGRGSPSPGRQRQPSGRKPSVLAGYVGVFTGCGALVALSCFLPLPTKFGDIAGVTRGQAVQYSFYVVAGVAACAAVFASLGLRNLRGEEGKGWRLLLLGSRRREGEDDRDRDSSDSDSAAPPALVPYRRLLRDSIRLGFTDPHIAIGYLGGFVARASTVAISLFIPLFVNTFFIRSGFCRGSPDDPSPDLKRECRSAYILASILTGVAQLVALVCAPLFGYVSGRPGQISWPVIIAASCGIVGYVAFPALRSPEFRDVDGRGGGAGVFLVVALLGISQIGAIVCSLGSLGRGVLAADVVGPVDPAEDAPLLAGEGNGGGGTGRLRREEISRVRLKGSIAGVYSWCGGAAILLLTKLGGFLFDRLSTGAPFYMMAMFNAALLVATVGIDVSRNVYTPA